jgi:Dolichyl-phosphate-mannose-protein mannosyltransferase
VVGVVLLLAAVALLVVAAALTTALLRPESALDGAITAGVVAAAGVVASVLLAGAPGALTPAAVLAAQAVWAVAAAALLRRRGTNLARAFGRRPGMPASSALRAHPWAAAFVALAVAALGWQLVVSLVLPPFAYDALSYHLTTVASWIRDESVDPTPLSVCCAYYPANAELVFTWPVLFLETDAIVDSVQVGFAVLGALATGGIARSAGLSRAGAAAAGALFAVTPAVLTQAPTNYADVMVAACVVAALHSLTRFAVTGVPERLVVAGLAAGIVLGIKGTGILWAAALVLVALVLVARAGRSGRLPRRGAALAVAAFLVPCLALGSYWYARNWIEVGNPVYPFRVEVAGSTVFDGPFEVDDVLTQPDPARQESRPVQVLRSWAADVDFWRQGSYEYEQRQGGLGPLWPWLGLPLLLLAALLLLRRRSAALIAFAAVVAVFVVQPYAWWARFTIPLMAVGAVGIATSADAAPRRWMRTAIRGAALALATAGVALSSFEVDPAARAEPLPSPDVLRLIGDPPEERTVGRLFFPEYRFVERMPNDATVAVDLRASAVRFVYPLFGPRHQRDVRPAGVEPVPGRWYVTSPGRPIDRALRRDRRFRLVSAERGVHAWRPAG